MSAYAIEDNNLDDKAYLAIIEKIIRKILERGIQQKCKHLIILMTDEGQYNPCMWNVF